MSYLDTPEFRKKRDQLRVSSGMRLKQFSRDLLEADAKMASQAPVVDTLSPEEFVEKVMSDRFADGEVDDDATEQDDHQG